LEGKHGKLVGMEYLQRKRLCMDHSPFPRERKALLYLLLAASILKIPKFIITPKQATEEKKIFQKLILKPYSSTGQRTMSNKIKKGQILS